MAEKEERITIHEVAYPCKKCSINCNKNDWKDCDFYQNYISGMTRTEAIEKMARAIFKWDNLLSLNYTFDEIMEHKRNLYLELAGTVLNALLEEGE